MQLSNLRNMPFENRQQTSPPQCFFTRELNGLNPSIGFMICSVIDPMWFWASVVYDEWLALCFVSMFILVYLGLNCFFLIETQPFTFALNHQDSLFPHSTRLPSIRPPNKSTQSFVRGPHCLFSITPFPTSYTGFIGPFNFLCRQDSGYHTFIVACQLVIRLAMLGG